MVGFYERLSEAETTGESERRGDIVSFDAELYKCKAVLLTDDKTIICGYYNRIGKQHFIDMAQINPYTLCRNTGKRVQHEYLYEGDLVEYRDGLSVWQMGFIDWDDFTNRFALRSSTNYSSRRDMRTMEMNIIGNIRLSHADMAKMQAYSDKQEQNYTPGGEPECRSTQYLNKKAKMFLPR